MFRTLDKLYSHSKWIYINKEADTRKKREKRKQGRIGNKRLAKKSVSKRTASLYNRSRGQVVMLQAVREKDVKW